MKEQRKYPRFECTGTAVMHFFGDRSSCPAVIEDLSLEGCRLQMLRETEIDPGSLFELIFTVNGLPFRLQGRATSKRKGRRVGVEFVDLRPESRLYLLDLIQELTPADGSRHGRQSKPVEGRLADRSW